MSRRIDDGFATFFTLANAPTIKIYEKEVTPPGFQGGGAIDITTMRNSVWRTQAPKRLKSMSNVSVTVAYAPDALEAIKAQIGVNQLITVTWPDDSTVQFYGWVDEFTPGANTEGEQPTASMTIIPSLQNAAGEETAPVYTDSDNSDSSSGV